MDEDYSTVDLITPLQDSWKIRVRLIRVWKPPLFSNPNGNGSIEKGNKIHATLKKSLIGTFLGVITEGSFKAISHFGVAANSDIIGKVVVVGDLITGDRNGKPSRRLTLEMQDYEMVNAYGTNNAIHVVPKRAVSYLSTPSSISEPDDFLTLNPKKRIDDLQEVDEVRVLDDSGSTSFLLFDKDVYKCIRKTALHVREDMLKDSIDSCTGEVDGQNVQLMSTATSPPKRTLQFDEGDITLQPSSTKAKIEVKLEKF
ncbi:OLC1v1018551C1 [Oldenlandia corymbosa var. corymbosa]|uniref:OLC1v1018551C1 n=1 Tax=Oldenlandia corymbosa var. corymbosa TaxID=529605 RepID=A0AAV1EC28_OLDCO|nr:OLC1v1018551C1 [Oldenlandia corymbosa var. corymbosa]